VVQKNTTLNRSQRDARRDAQIEERRGGRQGRRERGRGESSDKGE
jgi:hypothetical protein